MAKPRQDRKKSGSKPRRQQKDLPARGANVRGGGSAATNAMEAIAALSAKNAADSQAKADAIQANLDLKKALNKAIDSIRG